MVHKLKRALLCVQPPTVVSGAKLYQVQTRRAYDVGSVSPDLNGTCLFPPVTSLVQREAEFTAGLVQLQWKPFLWSQLSVESATEPTLPLPSKELTAEMVGSLLKDNDELLSMVSFGQALLDLLESRAAGAGLGVLETQLKKKVGAALQVQKDRLKLQEASCLAFSNDGKYFGCKGTKKDLKEVLAVS